MEHGTSYCSRVTVFFAIALALCLPAPGFSDTKVYPTPGKSVGVVRVDQASKWSVLGIGRLPDGMPTFIPVTPEIMDGGKLCLIEAGAGSYAVTAWPDGAAQPITSIVVLGGSPIPVPPIPPGPDPPVPPIPPGPLPIPGEGLRVMFVYESSDKTNVTNLIHSREVYDYLNAKCAKAANSVPEWRYFDQNVNLENNYPIWRDAMKRERKSLPWAVIANGKTGYEGPMPTNKADLLALLRKFGG